MAIEAGKAVLCEKPFMMNAAEAEEVIAAARSRGTFLMEAMWPRFHPHMARIREILSEGNARRDRLGHRGARSLLPPRSREPLVRPLARRERPA